MGSALPSSAPDVLESVGVAVTTTVPSQATSPSKANTAIAENANSRPLPIASLNGMAEIYHRFRTRFGLLSNY